MRTTSAIVICALTLGIGPILDADAVRGPQLGKQSWEWTLEERLARRFDPADVAERKRVYVAAHPEASNVEIEPQAIGPIDHVSSYLIDGERDPELFAPHELFESLVTALSSDAVLANKQRELYGTGIRQLGFDETAFWRELTVVTRSFVALKYDHALHATEDELCRARFTALEGARHVFGDQRFDQLLYSVVAPSRKQASSTNAVDPAASLRRAAEGCR